MGHLLEKLFATQELVTTLCSYNHNEIVPFPT